MKVQTSTKIFLLQIGNVLSFIFLLISNVAGPFLLERFFPMEFYTVTRLNIEHHTLLSPSFWIFLIWIPITLGLGSFVTYQSLKKWRNVCEELTVGNPIPRKPNFVEKIGPLFIINGILLGINTIAFSWGIFWLGSVCSAIVMLTCIFIYMKLGIGKKKFHKYHQVESSPLFVPTLDDRAVISDGFWEFWLVHTPFSLYTGWIEVCLVLNISITFRAIHLPIPDMFTFMVLAAYFILGCASLFWRKDAICGMVLALNLIAIGDAQFSSAITVAETALSLGIVLAILSIVIGCIRIHVYYRSTSPSYGQNA